MSTPFFEPSNDIISGKSADVYFRHTMSILKNLDINPVATMEFFSRQDGIFCGIEEVKSLLKKVLSGVECQVWALEEGAGMRDREVVLRITAPYRDYGLYETAIDGILAHCSGWATAAGECVTAAEGLPVYSFGARHIHPDIAAKMDYASIIGGCAGCSTTAGAELAGISPSGTMPHALILIIGDTVKATLAFDEYISPDISRISLVDTFIDEAEESLRVANALGEKLASVRLDTPFELGGVTPELVNKVRKALDTEGYSYVNIFVSGGMTPDRISEFIKKKSPVKGFGVGSYISGATPIDFTADLHEIDGKPIAKRGRTPGITPSPDLRQILW